MDLNLVILDSTICQFRYQISFILSCRILAFLKFLPLDILDGCVIFGDELYVEAHEVCQRAPKKNRQDPPHDDELGGDINSGRNLTFHDSSPPR
jgi:hypothetical protein